MTIYYDTGSGNRLKLIEIRPDDKGLYEDLDTGGRVVCSPDDVDLYPRK